FFFSSRRRHTRCLSDWSSDVCSSDLDCHQWDSPDKDFQNILLAVIAVVSRRTKQNLRLGINHTVCRITRIEADLTSDDLRIKLRSEERRVGKECRYGCKEYH